MPINKHNQYKQNLPDHVSHTGGRDQTEPAHQHSSATLGSSLIMLFSNGTEKLKKQISQGFPSLVLCIVVARWQDAGLCTVILYWDQWTGVTSGPASSPPPRVCHFTSQSPCAGAGTACSPATN